LFVSGSEDIYVFGNASEIDDATARAPEAILRDASEGNRSPAGIELLP
jgi:hypothetical protein